MKKVVILTDENDDIVGIIFNDGSKSMPDILNNCDCLKVAESSLDSKKWNVQIGTHKKETRNPLLVACENFSKVIGFSPKKYASNNWMMQFVPLWVSDENVREIVKKIHITDTRTKALLIENGYDCVVTFANNVG